MKILNYISLTILTVSFTLLTGCDGNYSSFLPTFITQYFQEDESQQKPLIQKKPIAQKSSQALASSTSVATKKAKKPIYRVGVDKHYPPYNMVDKKGRPIGFNIAILNAIARKQSFKLEITPHTLDTLLLHAEVGTYDMIMGNFATIDTSYKVQKNYNPSNPYIYTQDAIAFTNRTMNINTFTDLRIRSTSAVAGSSWEKHLKILQGDNPKILTYNSSFLAIKGLIKNKVEATFDDRGVLLFYSKNMPKQGIKVIGGGSYFEPYGLVILSHADVKNLNTKINLGLVQLVEDGTYNKIYRKWFGTDPIQLPVI